MKKLLKLKRLNNTLLQHTKYFVCWIKIINAYGLIYMKLTEIQLKHLNNCPKCSGNMHEAPDDTELLLVCDDCGLCMDSDGGGYE